MEATSHPQHTPRTFAYGGAEHQCGDLYLPQTPLAPVVCLLHGGFWRMPYGRDELHAVAMDLVDRGYAVWNLEYRRIGAAGGGWPGTFDDVVAGIDHLATLAEQGQPLDPARVIVAGHSAGGHLALWSAQGLRQTTKRVQPVAVAGLAAVADLRYAHGLGAGRNAVAELLGGSPEQEPARYAATSPQALLPLGVRQLLLHGVLDEALPVETARRYAQAATAAGDDVTYVELAQSGHMEFLDPSSQAHATFCRWLLMVCPA